jgi:hypothetical protein
MYLIGFANGILHQRHGRRGVGASGWPAPRRIAGSFQIGFGAVAMVLIGYLLTLTHSPMPVPIAMTLFAGLF